MEASRETALTPAPAFGVVPRPVLELVGIEVASEIGELELQTSLRIVDSFVVDGRTDLFEDEVEQKAGGQFADGFEVFFEVTLE